MQALCDSEILHINLNDIETMQTEFQEYFEDFFKEEEQKLRVMLELKLKAAKNSDKTQYHLEDNP